MFYLFPFILLFFATLLTFLFIFYLFPFLFLFFGCSHSCILVIVSDVPVAFVSFAILLYCPSPASLRDTSEENKSYCICVRDLRGLNNARNVMVLSETEATKLLILGRYANWRTKGPSTGTIFDVFGEALSV